MLLSHYFLYNGTVSYIVLMIFGRGETRVFMFEIFYFSSAIPLSERVGHLSI